MGKLTCRCGTILSDSGDSQQAYRGDLLPEMNLEKWNAAELQQLEKLVEVIKNGGSLADFAAPGSPHKEVIETLLTWKISGDAFFEYSRSVHQCHVCGRRLVETSQRNNFRTFLPESDESHNILNV